MSGLRIAAIAVLSFGLVVGGYLLVRAFPRYTSPRGSDAWWTERSAKQNYRALAMAVAIGSFAVAKLILAFAQ